MLDSENQPKVIREGLHGFKNSANKLTHTTLVGLAKEFNIDIGILLPDEIAEAEGDLDEALDRDALLRDCNRITVASWGILCYT